MICERSVSGVLDLYFYDELPPAERGEVATHLASCADCRQALADLELIGSALASRPAISSPPGGDWSRFMSRLDAAIDVDARAGRSRVVAFPAAPAAPPKAARGPARYLAIAATLALATTGLTYLASRQQPAAPTPVTTTAQTAPAASPEVDAAGAAQSAPALTADAAARAAFAQLSEQHFGRSKLVVLGVASKDAAHAREADWEYERQLASSLLTDTRLYRAAAEENGMATLASVLGDLELVLLQTSMAQPQRGDDLAQIQRLIRKRDLVTKMDVVTTTMDAAGTSGL